MAQTPSQQVDTEVAEYKPPQDVAIPKTVTTQSTFKPDATPDNATFKATTNTVNQADTSEGRLTGLLDRDSSLMQRAAKTGEMTANRRGLLNSSISAGASMGAMIDRATPIAQTDAQLIQNQQLQNQKDLNDAAKFNADTNSNIFMEGVKAGYENEKQNNAALLNQNTNSINNAEQFNYNTGLQEQKFSQAVTLAEVQQVQNLELENVKQKWQQLTTTNTSAAQVMAAYNSSIGQIMATKGLSVAQMKSALQALNVGLGSQLNVINAISGVDLSGIALPSASVNGKEVVTR